MQWVLVILGGGALVVCFVVVMAVFAGSAADDREDELRAGTRIGLALSQPSAGLQANWPDRHDAVRCYAVPHLHDMTRAEARAAERRGECEVVRLPRRGAA